MNRREKNMRLTVLIPSVGETPIFLCAGEDDKGPFVRHATGEEINKIVMIANENLLRIFDE